MDIPTIVKLHVFFALAALILAVILFIKRKWYFRTQKKISMSISKVIKELNRSITQFMTPGDETTPIQKPEKKKKKKNEHFVEINKILRKVEMELAKGELENSEKMLIEALALDPDHQEASKQLAFLYLKREKYSKAETLYLKLVEENCKDPVIFGNLGIALYSQDKRETAITAYQKAIDLDPDKASRYMSLGQIYFEMEDLKGALELFKRGLKKDPKNLDYLFVLANAYKVAELYEQCAQTYKQILEIEPYNEEAKLALMNLRDQGVNID